MTASGFALQFRGMDDDKKIIDAEYEVIQGPDEAKPLPAKTKPQWREDLLGVVAVLGVIVMIFVIGKAMRQIGALALTVFYR